jgi:hypothetical protein
MLAALTCRTRDDLPHSSEDDEVESFPQSCEREIGGRMKCARTNFSRGPLPYPRVAEEYEYLTNSHTFNKGNGGAMLLIGGGFSRVCNIGALPILGMRWVDDLADQWLVGRVKSSLNGKSRGPESWTLGTVIRHRPMGGEKSSPLDGCWHGIRTLMLIGNHEKTIVVSTCSFFCGQCVRARRLD